MTITLVHPPPAESSLEPKRFGAICKIAPADCVVISRVLTDKYVSIERNEPSIICHPEFGGFADEYRGIHCPSSLAVPLGRIEG